MLRGEETTDQLESTIMDTSSLKDMKYSELRQLAKSVGIKANAKKEKLLKELEAYYSGLPNMNAENDATESGTGTDDSAEEGEASGPEVTSPKPASQETNGLPTSKGSGNKRSQSKTPPSAQKERKDKVTPQPAKRKRTNTPQLLQEDNADENTPKRRRRNTYELQEAKVATPEVAAPADPSSPGVSDLMEAMANRRDSADMKASLLSVLDKKVQDKRNALPKEEKGEEEMMEVAPGTQIPRFVTFLKKKNAETKPVTPGNKDWKKIHQKEFSRFDSIDVYLAKKQQRTRTLSQGKAKASASDSDLSTLPSASKVKQAMAETKAAINKLRNNKTPTSQAKVVKPVQSRASLFSPKQPFKPTVLNTKALDLNFTTRASPKTKAPGKPLASASKKTPAKPSAANLTVTEDKESMAPKSARKSLGAKASAATPFKFSASTTMNTSTTAVASSKKKFDLQASLARPLTWKPYTGKLKPLEGSNPAASLNTTAAANASTSKPDLKRRSLKSRDIVKPKDKMRANVTKKRNAAKTNSQMSRRGLAFP